MGQVLQLGMRLQIDAGPKVELLVVVVFLGYLDGS